MEYHLQILAYLEDVVLSVASNKMLELRPLETSLQGSWYLSPKQHGLEFLIFNVLNVWMVIKFMKSSLAQTYLILKGLECLICTIVRRD